MKKWLIAAACLVSTAAVSQVKADYCYNPCNPCPTVCNPCDCNSPWYIGLGVNENGVFHDSGTINLISLDNWDGRAAWGGHIFFGYELNRCVSLELGYIYLGHTHGETDFDVDGNTDFYSDTSWAIPLRAKLAYPFCDDFEVFALAGVNYYNQNVSTSETVSTTTTTRHITRSGISLTYGVGLGWTFCDTWGIRLAANRYGFSTNYDHWKEALELTVTYDF